MACIRLATSQDRKVIRKVYADALPESENRKVSTLALNLLNDETNPQTISLVAEADGIVVGHIAFSPVSVPNDRSWTGYILAPLGVKPEYQKRRIGSKLIKSGMERVSKLGADVVFVYGDPNFYGRFSFNPDVASKYSPPYQLECPFGWQAAALNDNVIPDSATTISCVASLSDPELW